MLIRLVSFALAACVAFLAYAPTLRAQPETTWTSVAKIAVGNCEGGSIAYVTERPGVAHFRLSFPDGRQYAEFDVTLAVDGSGKAQFTATISGNVVNFEIVPGTGKRLLKTFGVTRRCDYTWTPK